MVTKDDITNAGYNILENGDVIGKRGKPLKPRKYNNLDQVILNIGGISDKFYVQDLLDLFYPKQEIKQEVTKPQDFVGVVFDKRCGFWIAQIELNGEQKQLGWFPTKEKAAIAYDKALVKYFNKPKVNFPEE